MQTCLNCIYVNCYSPNGCVTTVRHLSLWRQWRMSCDSTSVTSRMSCVSSRPYFLLSALLSNVTNNKDYASTDTLSKRQSRVFAWLVRNAAVQASCHEMGRLVSCSVTRGEKSTRDRKWIMFGRLILFFPFLRHPLLRMYTRAHRTTSKYWIVTTFRHFLAAEQINLTH